MNINIFLKHDFNIGILFWNEEGKGEIFRMGVGGRWLVVYSESVLEGPTQKGKKIFHVEATLRQCL